MLKVLVCRVRIKYTVPQVDKGTSLPCYVNMCRTGVTCIFTCSTHLYILIAAEAADPGGGGGKGGTVLCPHFFKYPKSAPFSMGKVPL